MSCFPPVNMRAKIKFRQQKVDTMFLKHARVGEKLVA